MTPASTTTDTLAPPPPADPFPIAEEVADFLAIIAGTPAAVEAFTGPALDQLATVGPDGLLLHLRMAQEAIDALRTYAGELEGLIMDSLPGGVYDCALGHFEVMRGTARKTWQTDVLRELVPTRAATDPDTGEVDPGRLEAARKALGAAGASWRAGGLKALGINPDLYCEATPGGGNRLQAQWAEEPAVGEQGL